MKRGRIARPPQPDRPAHEEREDPDGREHEIERAGTCRHRRHTNIDDFTRAQSQRRVAKGSVPAGRVEDRQKIGDLLYWAIVNREQQIASTDSDRCGRRIRRDLGGDDTFGVLLPEHTILNLMPRRTRRDIRGAKNRSPDTTTSGRAGRDHRLNSAGHRAGIQCLERVIQSNGAENDAKNWGAPAPLGLVS